jgi:hypothetical protein
VILELVIQNITYRPKKLSKKHLVLIVKIGITLVVALLLTSYAVLYAKQVHDLKTETKYDEVTL